MTDFITANIITRVPFIIHCFILFIVCSSTVVGRISNVFIVVYSHSLYTSVGILRSGIDCLCKQYILSSASSTMQLLFKKVLESLMCLCVNIASKT